MLRRNPGPAARPGSRPALTLAILAVATCAAGAGLGHLRSAAQNSAPAQPQSKADAHGDPLPPGARARLGTVRWRHGEPVTFAAFALDGKAVVTASVDGTL